MTSPRSGFAASPQGAPPAARQSRFRGGCLDCIGIVRCGARRAWKTDVNRLCILLIGWTIAGTVSAHDTWFAPQPGGVLALGTGNRFPVTELAVDDKFFAKRGCLAADGTPAPLDKLRFTDKTTLLRPKAAAQTCFVQLEPFEIELPPDKIDVYFKEIRPSAAVLAAWSELKARGLPFKERYTKSARIDLGREVSPHTTGTAMDALRVSPAGGLTVGSTAVFQLLQNGKPLPDFAVELVNERSPLGLWHRTDADGRISARLPLPGRWLLRGTELRLSPNDATAWESQFITYAFDVQR
jgi:hypothetical protein